MYNGIVEVLKILLFCKKGILAMDKKGSIDDLRSFHEYKIF